MQSIHSKGIRKASSAGEMGERAYAYAKACGIIGKSFVGKKTQKLESVNGLSELDRMVFQAGSQNLPEKELLVNLEDRIIGRAVDSIISIVECFSKPPEFLTLLVRSYEYADLKSFLVSFLEREKTAPSYTNIGRFQTVRFDAWPDVRRMLEGTEFDFLLDKGGALYNELNGIALQTILDRHYYSALWKALYSLAKNDRVAAEKILTEEISLKNSGLALRLRTYYWMNSDEVKLHLIYVPTKGGDFDFIPGGQPDESPRAGEGKKNKPAKHFSHFVKDDGGKKLSLYKSRSRSLAEEAIECLDFPLDNFAAWSSWCWKGFLNPDTGEGNWHADPRYFQNAASRHLSSLAKRYFHLNPSSLDAIFCFIKLKQFEEDVLTSSAEGLGMGMSGKDIASVLGGEW